MAKRVFDLALGTVLALLALPLIVLCAIGVVLTLHTNPFFVQRRVGRGGQEFLFFKLRTLPKSAPRYADKYTISNLRIPAFTAMLRRLHLDELPQLFLVPLGKMSLVGPRPEMPTLHGELPGTFAQVRTSVRPGCTGLWQIGRDADGLIGESPRYDQFYLDNQNLKLDLWILARTVGVLAGRPTIVDLRDVPATLQRSVRGTEDALVAAGAEGAVVEVS